MFEEFNTVNSTMGISYPSATIFLCSFQESSNFVQCFFFSFFGVLSQNRSQTFRIETSSVKSAEGASLWEGLGHGAHQKKFETKKFCNTIFTTSSWINLQKNILF